MGTADCILLHYFNLRSLVRESGRCKDLDSDTICPNCGDDMENELDTTEERMGQICTTIPPSYLSSLSSTAGCVL